MNLKDFYRLVLRNLLIVVLSTLAGLGAAGGVTYLSTPMYEAKIQLFVSTQSSDFDISSLVQGSSFTQQRVKSYAQIIPSPTTLAPVVQKLQLEISAEELSKRVKSSAPLDTVLINVSVTDESPMRAASIANGIGEYFSSFVNNLELSKADNSPPIKVSVVKTATIPEDPSSPRTTLNLLLGLILGFGLGVGVAILRQLFDTTIKNENDLDQTPLLGAIGFDEEAQSKPLITTLSRYSARTEAFRQIRTNLQYIRADQPPKVVAVTSAVPSEGKTSTSINLALSLAQSGFKVAFIEGDMRRPKCSTYLERNSKVLGLSEVLTGIVSESVEESITSVVQQLDEVSILTFLSSGAIPQNPAELLDSKRFDSVIDYFRENYDFTILDCPPALPVADASIISTRVDGVIVIIEAGKTRRNQFLGVREVITQVGGQILGVVLNKIPHSRTSDDYGYRYGYGYGYRGKYGYRYSGYKSYKPYASQTEGQIPQEGRDRT
jgi:capsular exopolysaccharide synthesis family protein